MMRTTLIGALVLGALSMTTTARAEGLRLEASFLDDRGVTAGLEVGEQLVLLAGVRGFVFEEESFFLSMWQVPLEAKIYFTPPAAGTVAPALVLSGAYVRQATQSDVRDGIGLRALIGVDYFVTGALGVHASVGAGHDRLWGATDATITGAVGRLGVVLRL